ncbi:serine hydrolase FSH [Penicillium pulvis]|uniref:serine hydrolase FSH n=1 Tax=Penicillium pulvis TaxID=1562058 RepID=UPI00254722AE|nr:serine hydrolase FSH [Penicillium pulvis]KAJ5798333.1 serine hydrolase FSH [Penicillium pulvis]
MLLHARTRGQKSPFQAAIFIVSPTPFFPRADCGIDARRYFGIAASEPSRPGALMRVTDYLVTDLVYLKKGKGAEDVLNRIFHATVGPYRISISIAPAQGSQDQWRRHGLDLVQLYARVTVVEHGEGHGVPARYREEIVNAVGTVMVGSEGR